MPNTGSPPSRRGRSAVTARRVAMAPPATRQTMRPVPLHHRRCWRSPSDYTAPASRRTLAVVCAGKHSLSNAPACHKTGTDRPSGGLQAVDRSWCQSPQGGLCSTPTDTTLAAATDCSRATSRTCGPFRAAVAFGVRDTPSLVGNELTSAGFFFGCRGFGGIPDFGRPGGSRVTAGTVTETPIRPNRAAACVSASAFPLAAARAAWT